MTGQPTGEAPEDLRDEPEQWPVVSSTDLHRDGWVVALRSDEVGRPVGGATFRRLVLEHPGAVIVLAVDDEGQVVCLRQYRHVAGRRFVELPAGLCDVEGEDPEQVARRELLEEAGLQATSWTHLASTWSSPGISTEVMHFFLATGLTEADRGDFVAEHEEADLELFRAPYDALLDAALAGRVADGPLLTALLLARVRGLAPASAAAG